MGSYDAFVVSFQLFGGGGAVYLGSVSFQNDFNFISNSLLTAGETYYISVDSLSGLEGLETLTFTFFGEAAHTNLNTDRAEAAVLVLDTPVRVICSDNANSENLWYAFTPAANGVYRLYFTEIDTLYEENNYFTSSYYIGDDNESAGMNLSQEGEYVEITVTAGTAYYFRTSVSRGNTCTVTLTSV